MCGQPYTVKVDVNGTEKLPALYLTWMPLVILNLTLYCLPEVTWRLLLAELIYLITP